MICTDKTGTLTAGEMTVTVLWTGRSTIDVSGAGYSPEGDFRANGSILPPSEHEALMIALRIGALAD